MESSTVSRPPQAIAPYLDPRFSQSLDRSRPLELVVLYDRKGKPRDPTKQNCLLYRYTDTGEEALVPNIWYNQTLEMRQVHWKFQARVSDEQVKKAADNLAFVEAAARRRNPTQPVENDRDVRHARWHVEALVEVNQRTHKALEECLAGKLL